MDCRPLSRDKLQSTMKRNWLSVQMNCGSISSPLPSSQRSGVSRHTATKAVASGALRQMTTECFGTTT
jgi:hypothetical protein